MIFLYLLTQTLNREYEHFDSCVVADTSADSARLIHPLHGANWDGKFTVTWAHVDDIKVRLIGVAGPDVSRGEVICTSFCV